MSARIALGIAGGILFAAAGDLLFAASIRVDAARITGSVHPYIFGQFIEHEYNTIEGGLWAELLRDRKFEQGDNDRDGVSDGWVPEERITNRYWELVEGRSPGHRYFVDHHEYYGGGASQAIEISRPGDHAGICQIQRHLVQGRKYSFYVYLKWRGDGKAWVDVEKLRGRRYFHHEFASLSDEWRKYTAEFSAPETTEEARIRITFEGTGTLWIDSASLMPADNLRGMRRDVIEALRPLRIPIMRYPGGCFVDGYHWKNGIGDRDRRPETWTAVWKHWEPNDFGIDEFIDFAHELGFEPHITTNYGSGTPEEARQWVEYTNGAANTPLGGVRARNGHRQPYSIKYWAVGNEAAELCAGEYIGETSVQEYVDRFRQYSTAIRSVDPSIRMMAVGVPPGPPEWNRQLLELTPVDLIAMSIYTGSFGRDPRICDYQDFYHKVVAEPLELDRKLDEVIRGIGPLLPKSPFVAITELNSWWLPETVDPDYRLGNALYFAGVFNALLRRADQVFAAEASTTLNVQGILGINAETVKLTPPYFAYLLYRNHIGSRVIESRVNSPATIFNPELTALDAVATLDSSGNALFLSVVNRNETADVPTTIAVENWTRNTAAPVRVYELNGTGTAAANPFGSTKDVNIRERQLETLGTPFEYAFPAHSVTVLELSGKGL